jgi:hypothetical protein
LDDFTGVMQPEHIGSRPYTHAGYCFAQAKMTQHMHRIGAELNSGAHYCERGSLLEKLDLVAGLHQTRGR